MCVKMSQEIITTQPSGFTTISTLGVDISDPLSDRQQNTKSCPVTVRNLTDSPADCMFAGQLVVEAFRGKMIHLTSERSLPQVKECMGEYFRGQLPIFYERKFVAECEGERAGLLFLKFHADPRDRNNGAFRSIGNCDKISLCCLNWASMLDYVSRGECCVDVVCVLDKFRGKGIGKVLMQTAENEARKLGTQLMYLLVTTTNRARSLYEREGYTVQSTTSYLCLSWCVTGERAFYRMEKPLG